MPRAELHATYTRLRDARKEVLRGLAARDRLVSMARVASLLAGAAGLGMSVWSSVPQIGTVLMVGGVLAFFALVLLHGRLDDKTHRFEAAVRYFERGLHRLDGELDKLGRTGERHLSAKHPYADDLDLFGKESLFTLLDSTETEFGEETLARWLLGGEKIPDDALRDRQGAVKDAAGRAELREAFSIAGNLVGRDKPDPRPFVAWVEKGDDDLAPGIVVVLARAIPLVSIGLFALGQFHLVPRWAWAISVALGVLVSRSYGARTFTIVTAASTKQSGLRRFAELFRLVAKEPFSSARLVALQKELAQTGATAADEMDRLGLVTSFLDARENEVFRFLIAPIFMWDLNCAIALAAWKKRNKSGIATWFRVLGELEAIFSLAAFHDEQEAVFPELVAEPVFDATALGHPILHPKKRVVNDVSLAPALIVTGSNMSGKSTLLRTIGVACVLARAGAPVCATQMRIGPLTVATSLRVRDSLGDGVSRFYAELEKIKTVVETSEKKRPALFLLDEVLAGTNARERIAGASSIVRALLASSALGAVSTHDLELTKLEEETGGKTKNVHFEEQVEGDVMTFDYKLRPGVVTTSNALRLMRALGLPIDA